MLVALFLRIKIFAVYTMVGYCTENQWFFKAENMILCYASYARIKYRNAEKSAH